MKGDTRDHGHLIVTRHRAEHHPDFDRHTHVTQLHRPAPGYRILFVDHHDTGYFLVYWVSDHLMTP